MSNTISVCLIAKNEEQLIGNCLSSVSRIADEVIVVDTGSTDRTRVIAEGFGAHVIQHKWNGSYGSARNVYLRAARGDWILILDADETIAREDLAKIERLVRRRSVIGYRLTVRNYTDEHDLMWNWVPNDCAYPGEEEFSACPGWMKTLALRLFRNFPDLEYLEGNLTHTTLIESLRKHPGRIEDLDNVAIHHFQYLKGGSRFLSAKQRLKLKSEILHVKQFPQDPDPYLNIAKTLFAEKRDKEALSYLARAVKLDRSFHDAYQLWGMIELANGRLSSAEKQLKRALRIRAESADAWALLGITLVEGGRHSDGMRALKTALQLHPQHLLAHNSLGVLYEDLGMQEEARKQYLVALQLHPRFRPAKANLARLMKARTQVKNQRRPRKRR